jgi:hypothetical protein
VTQNTRFHKHPVPWEPGSIRPRRGCYSPQNRVRTSPLPFLPRKDHEPKKKKTETNNCSLRSRAALGAPGGGTKTNSVPPPRASFNFFLQGERPQASTLATWCGFPNLLRASVVPQPRALLPCPKAGAFGRAGDWVYLFGSSQNSCSAFFSSITAFGLVGSLCGGSKPIRPFFFIQPWRRAMTEYIDRMKAAAEQDRLNDERREREIVAAEKAAQALEKIAETLAKLEVNRATAN